MIFEMNLNLDPFKKIACGEKTIELRLFDHKRSQLNIGDYIIFTNASNKNCRIAVEIKALHRYGSFIELFSDIPPKSCGYPENTTPEDAVSSIRN